MKTNNNTQNENKNGMQKIIVFAAELLNNGATVESVEKYGYQFREIKKDNFYICLCASDFAEAAAIAAEMENTEEATEPTEKKNTTAARVLRSVRATLSALFAILKNYAAALTSAAALIIARVLFMAAGAASGLAVMFAAALLLPSITPDGFAACLLLRVPALFAAVCLWAIAYNWAINKVMPARVLHYIMNGTK